MNKEKLPHDQINYYEVYGTNLTKLHKAYPIELIEFIVQESKKLIELKNLYDKKIETINLTSHYTHDYQFENLGIDDFVYSKFTDPTLRIIERIKYAIVLLNPSDLKDYAFLMQYYFDRDEDFVGDNYPVYLKVGDI